MIIFYIIMAVIAALGFVIPTLIRKNLREDKYYDDTCKALGVVRYIIVGVACIIALITTLVRGIEILDSTEVGVVKTFGRIDHTIGGGINFVNPISDKVDIYDMRIHVRQAEFASYTKDAQPVTASVEYQYELQADNVMEVAQQFGSYEILETKLAAVVEERAKIVFARYGAMPLLENRSTLSMQVRDEVSLLEESFPIHFTSVVVKDIDFSDAFEAAVEAKMQAEQNALRAENEKKEAITRAEQEKEVAAINAEAIIAEAEGEARALEIKRAALENMPDTWIEQQYLEKWDGKLPQFISGDNTGVMLTPDF